MDIYIAGASGLAREVANYILDLGHQILGFLEKDAVDKSQTIIIRGVAYPVVSDTDFFYFRRGQKEKVGIVIAVGFPDLRKKLFEKFRPYCDFPNIIHPTAILCDTSILLGEGNIIAPNCILTTSIKIGDCNLINWATTIGHDVKVGNYNVFNPSVSVSGNIYIEDDNFIGCGAMLRQGIKIGKGNTVGMGAVVLNDVGNVQVMLGVPAKPILK